MDFLLDTHTFLWFISGNLKLSATARALIDDDKNEIAISVVSVWEIVIKSSLGKLPLKGTVAELFRDEIYGNEFQILPMSQPHFEILSTLPQHHRDPFDRMIVSQAVAEGLPLITVNDSLTQYPIQRIW